MSSFFLRLGPSPTRPTSDSALPCDKGMPMKLRRNTFGIEDVLESNIAGHNGQVGLSIQVNENEISPSEQNYIEAPVSSCSSNSVDEGDETSEGESESEGTSSSVNGVGTEELLSEEENLSVDQKEHNGQRRSCNFVVKAKYEEYYVKFECPQSSSMEEVRDKVGKKFEIEPSKFKLMYMDHTNEMILMTNTTDLVNAFRVTTERNDTTVWLWVVDA